jgi:MoxR-like ATPase
MDSVPGVRDALAEVGYLADEAAALVAYLAQHLGKPVLVEGPAGVGKTELAKALSRATGRELIRLQCYEGLDEAKALYEWNYRKQLLRIQAESKEEASSGWEATRGDIFGEEFLLTRPLLAAIASPDPVVLLIDEIDKTDQEFEAMLLEVLSDFQISIPELGVIEARTHPVVVLTSNNSRELTEALKRRCLYLWLDYPEVEREMEIVRLHTPELDERLARRLVAAVDRRVDRLGEGPAAARQRRHRPLGVRAHDEHHRQAPHRHRSRRRAGRGEALRGRQARPWRRQRLKAASSRPAWPRAWSRSARS